MFISLGVITPSRLGDIAGNTGGGNCGFHTNELEQSTIKTKRCHVKISMQLISSVPLIPGVRQHFPCDSNF